MCLFLKEDLMLMENFWILWVPTSEYFDPTLYYFEGLVLSTHPCWFNFLSLATDCKFQRKGIILILPYTHFKNKRQNFSQETFRIYVNGKLIWKKHY